MHDQVRLYDEEQARERKERVFQFIAGQLRVARESLGSDFSKLKWSDADSLDIVELVMELEEELD